MKIRYKSRIIINEMIAKNNVKMNPNLLVV